MRSIPRTLCSALLFVSGVALAGFPGTDLFVPAVARASGAGGSEFFSTLWITNTGTADAAVGIELLVQGQPNPSPEARSLTLAAGATRRIDDVVGAFFGVSGKGAALRVRADQPLLVSSRTYDEPPGTELKDTKGLFFSGIPASLAIGAGQTTLLQGISTAASEFFRYNFGLVETTGAGATVSVTVEDESGVPLSSPQQVVLGPFEARQVNDFAGFVPGVSTANGLLKVQVIAGGGKVIAYGTQIAGTTQHPGSNDASGFEMAFTAASAGLPGVTKLNGLTGDVTLKAGPNVTVAASGSSITIGAAGSLSGVTAGAGLTGGGSSGSPSLAIAEGGVTTAMLQDGAVTAAKLAPAVSSAHAASCGLAANSIVYLPAQTHVVVPFNQCDAAEGVTGLGTQAFRYTAPFAGTYQVNAAVAVVSSIAGYVDLAILRNGTAAVIVKSFMNPAVSTTTSVSASRVLKLGAGDTVQADVFQSTDGTRPLLASQDPWNAFSVARVGD